MFVTMGDVWGLLRTRRWLSFTLAGLIAIGAFGLLSHWQWLRAQEEEAKSAAVAAGAATDPVPLASVLDPGSTLVPQDEWRPVLISGEMACERGYLIRNRPLSPTNGMWAGCPMQTAAGDWVWVNRGWLPAPGAATAAVDMPASSSGQVQVTGRLRASESGPAAIPADLPAGQATHLDTPVLSAEAGLDGPVYLPYVEVTAQDPADPGDLTPLPLPPADSAQNYSYAGQWLLFAAITVGGWWYFLRREAREDAAANAGGVAQPTR
jgi:cytochrome oxidase assembly protein ShyY1